MSYVSIDCKTERLNIWKISLSNQVKGKRNICAFLTEYSREHLSLNLKRILKQRIKIIKPNEDILLLEQKEIVIGFVVRKYPPDEDRYHFTFDYHIEKNYEKSGYITEAINELCKCLLSDTGLLFIISNFFENTKQSREFGIENLEV